VEAVLLSKDLPRSPPVKGIRAVQERMILPGDHLSAFRSSDMYEDAVILWDCL
jgi:hypothetical protein